jgi:DNA-binding MarR family transcriptional regulator
VLVELTAEGHRRLESTVDELLGHEEALLNGLSADQRQQLAELLRVLLGDLTRRFELHDRP